MAASMNCMGGQALKLFLQIYGTSLRCNRLQMGKCMCDHSISPKISFIKSEKPDQNKYTDDFLGIIDEQDRDDDRFDSHNDEMQAVSKISPNAMSTVDDSVNARKTFTRRSRSKDFQSDFENIKIKKTSFGLVRFDENTKIKSNIGKSRTKSSYIEKPVLNKRVKQTDTVSSWQSVDYDISKSDIFGTNKFHNKTSGGKDENEEQSDDHLDNLMHKEHVSRQNAPVDPRVELNFIDGQYFENTSSDGTNSTKHFENKNAHRELNYTQSSEMGYIDDQYFTSPGSGDMGTVFSQTQVTTPENVSEELEDTENMSGMRYSKSQVQDGKRTQSKVESHVSKTEFVNTSDVIGRRGHGKSKETTQSVDESHTAGENRPSHSREKIEPKTAYEMAMKLKREIKSKGSPINQKNLGKLNDLGHETERHFAGPVDSKGFRILKNQVPDFENTPSAMIVNELKKNIIFERDDVIAIYKPYGLPSHGGPGVRVSVGQLLPQLYELMSGEQNSDILHLIHRLDKETTGVMLLAKTAEMAWRLKTAFRKQEVTKTYWVIVKGIPSPYEGIIDIPMTEALVEGVHRMVLRPDYTEDTKLVGKKRTSSKLLRAVTQYRVLDSYDGAALVECRPQTGIKHQIRVHLAYGLNTPILGDHKYSHFTKLAPQRLYPEMLQRLGIRQSKVRHVPMHLHAKSIVIPEILDGKNLSVTCRLPQHFVTNMSRLKLKPPKHS